ncbi:MAG: Gfo/Idh/MocA family protein [Pirellula sp.]|jgi:predicted dehydrogenase|nr:Gfo/Idh/MocA family oxidoreductase [Pirellula sp.]
MIRRRDILIATSTVATASLCLPTVAKGFAFHSVKPSEKITLGFIGVGKQSLGHLNKFLGNTNVEVVAVCDVVQARMDKASEMVATRYADRSKSGGYKGLKQFKDFRQLIALDGLDAVVIGTPDHWHAIPCILAARAGKHIYCEKPLTHNIAEGRVLVNEVNKAKIIFQTGSQQRSEFGGHFRRAVETIWSGRIGQVKRIRIGVGNPSIPCDLPTEEIPAGTDWDLWTGPAPMRGYNKLLCPEGVHNHFPQWRMYDEYAGGGLADMGAHHFDIAQWAIKMDKLGPVQIIPPEDRKATSGLRFLYENGIEMIHNVFEDGIKADCVFEGTEGMLLVSRNGISTRPSSILEQPLTDKDQRVMASNNHHQNWIDAIKSNSECICPAEIGHRSATVCHLGNIGYRLGRPLRWDPIAEQFKDDAEANKHCSREPRAEWKI